MSGMKLVNADLRGVIQLHPQEAAWIAQAAGAQAGMIENSLAKKQVPIQHIRESTAMATGLRNLAERCARAFNELTEDPPASGDVINGHATVVPLKKEKGDDE